MKHFIYVALAISSVAMFAANVAGTALLRSESKKNHLETKGFGKRAKYGLGGLAVGVVAGKMMSGSRNRGYSSRGYSSSYGSRSYGSNYGSRSYGSSYGSKSYGSRSSYGQQAHQQTAAAQAYALLDRKIKTISEQKCGETETQCRLSLKHFKDQSTGNKDEFTRMSKCLQLKDKNGDFCCMASDISKYYYKDVCVPINPELLDNPVFNKLNKNDQDNLTKQLDKDSKDEKRPKFFRI